MGFQKLSDPKATGITACLFSGQSMVCPDHLVAICDIRPRPKKQCAVAVHVLQIPIIAIGHDLHVLIGHFVGDLEHLIMRIAYNHIAIIVPADPCCFGRWQNIENAVTFYHRVFGKLA